MQKENPLDDSLVENDQSMDRGDINGKLNSQNNSYFEARNQLVYEFKVNFGISPSIIT